MEDSEQYTPDGYQAIHPVNLCPRCESNMDSVDGNQYYLTWYCPRCEITQKGTAFYDIDGDRIDI